MLLSAGIALFSAAHAETWPPGATIESAATADITPEGFDAIAELIPSMLPSEIALDDMAEEYEGAWGQCWLGGYAFSVSGMWVGIEVASADITPGNGVLDVRIDLNIWVNDSSDPFDLYTELECIGDTCYGHVAPFPVTVTTTMALDVVEGTDGPQLDATIGEIVADYPDDLGSYITLDDCAIGTVEEVLNFLGLSLYDLLIDQLSGTLEDQIAEMGPELETAIEDAFGSASIDEELDVNGVIINLQLYPSDVEITPAGVRLQMSGSMSGDAADCVADYDPGGSLKTLTDPPGIGTAPSGITTPFHVGLSLSDDIANEAFYALWRGGLLCYTIGQETFPIDTSILNSLSGDSFEELFPESQPVTLRTAPEAPPTVFFTGEHDVGIHITDLGLEFFAELDGREARMLSVQLDGDAGIDLTFDGTTGDLAVLVALDPNQLTPSIAYNEIIPSANDAILAGFQDTFGSLLDTMLGSMLSDLAFALPSFEGIGLQDLQLAAAGDQSDWLGAYAWIGAVSYTGGSSSCGGCGGDTGGSADTGGSGCSGGCGVLGAPFAPGFWALATLVMLRRRR
ncbi:MAG: hypothetical protein ACOZNI_35925 [Myxococcota bacterium]